MNPKYQRGPDGNCIPGDAVTYAAYGPIPEAYAFQNEVGGVEVPAIVHHWGWSTTFGRWGAVVTFKSGWHGFTWPFIRLGEFPFQTVEVEPFPGLTLTIYGRVKAVTQPEKLQQGYYVAKGGIPIPRSELYRDERDAIEKILHERYPEHANL
jgi:hypothetical protein